MRLPRGCTAWVLWWLLIVVISGRAAERGLQVVDRSGQAVVAYPSSYALVIGASHYTHGWPSLPGVVDDTRLVRDALQAQGFEVTMIQDPTSVELQQAFQQFITRYGLVPEHRLLIYFAGHGHTEKQAYGEEMGYIVPIDAPNPYEDRQTFLATAMDMQQMEVYAKRIQAKHVLFLFDSCFSGSIFSLSRAVPEHISYKTSQPVRQFITSGSAAEQVPDASIFRQQFLAALQGEADTNSDGYITGTELGVFLQDKVVNYSKGAQHPQYGKIRNPHLDKGDFVFTMSAAVTAALGTAENPGPIASREAGHTSPDTPGTEVPNVLGKTSTEAEQLLSQQQLTFEQAGTRPVALVALNTIVDQEPRGGTRVALGSTVKLTLGTQEALARTLIAQAVATHNQIDVREPIEHATYWWSLLQNKGRADLLQRSVLLAAESLQRFPGTETENALRRGLSWLTRPLRTLEHPSGVTALVFSAASPYLASASNAAAQVWESPGGRSVGRFLHKEPVRSVVFSPNGQWLATASDDGSAAVWEVASGKQLVRLAHENAVVAVAFSPNGQYLATASADKSARLWELPDGKQVARCAHDEALRLLLFSPDGRYLATASGALTTPASSNTARLWAVPEGQEVVQVKHDRGIQAMAFHPNSTSLATASDDRTVRVWSVPEGKESSQFLHKSSVQDVTFSPDGHFLASASRDTTARVWSLSNGQEVARVRHDDSVEAVRFHPQGTSIVTASQDATARVWAVADGQEILRVTHRQPIRAVAFSPDGKFIATASDDSTVQLWEIWPQDVLVATCQRLSRNLTPEEWRQYLGEEPYRKTCSNLP